jgi:hypothetical protein
MKKLEKLEAQLRSLIEEHLLKALPGSKLEIQIARQLAAAMHSWERARAEHVRARRPPIQPVEVAK